MPSTAPASPEPASRQPTARVEPFPTIEKLVAYTKLFGYLRYFHPSDEAANADWEALAVDAAGRVERAGDAWQLARELEDVFRQVAPTLRVNVSGARRQAPVELQPPNGDPNAAYVGWVHHGLPSQAPYWSVRASNRFTPHGRPGELTARIPIAPGERRRLHVKAWVRTEGTQDNGGAAIVFGSFDNVERSTTKPSSFASWSELDLSRELDADERYGEVTFRLSGEGKLFVDDVRVWSENDRGPSQLSVENPGFELGPIDSVPSGWRDLGDLGAGYVSKVSTENPHSGARCAEIEAKPLPVEKLSRPSETFHVSLGAGVEADVPLSLYVDAQGRTLPVSARRPTPPSEPIRKRIVRYSDRERAVRVADVALAWNAAQHFYPYFDDVDADWPAALTKALSHALQDTDEQDFFKTLSHLWASLHDGHGLVLRLRADANGVAKRLDMAFLPVVWRVVQGKLVITDVAEGVGDVKVGDIVTSINGQPAEEAIREQIGLTSAATEQWAREYAAVQLLSRERGDTVSVLLSRADGSSHAVSTRASLTPTSFLPQDRHRPVIREIEPDIQYVDTARATDADFDAAMPKLRAARGIVFDVRGYPSRFSSRSLRHVMREPYLPSSSWIPTVTRPDRRDVHWTEWGGVGVNPAAPFLTTRVAFLIDGRAISNAETILENVVKQRLGAIVGSPTAGTDGNNVPVLLPGGFVLGITGLKVVQFDGSRLHGIGIRPTVPCEPTIAGIAAGRDEVLECGVAAVKGTKP